MRTDHEISRYVKARPSRGCASGGTASHGKTAPPVPLRAACGKATLPEQRVSRCSQIEAACGKAITTLLGRGRRLCFLKFCHMLPAHTVAKRAQLVAACGKATAALAKAAAAQGKDAAARGTAVL